MDFNLCGVCDDTLVVEAQTPCWEGGFDSPADGSLRHGWLVVTFYPELCAPIGVAVFPHTAPHYLLLTQAQSDHQVHSSRNLAQGGVWRFVLEEIGGEQRIEVSETEPGVWGERLQLLAVVRGLEALEQPSKVTLITPSRFVGTGIRINLAQWRENDWQWEHFGEMIEIKNVDLWKRIDQALHFHRLDCRVWDFDVAQTTVPVAEPVAPQVRARNNRITFEQLQRGRNSSRIRQSETQPESFRIKPQGRGRAFGLYDPAALSTVSFTG